MMGLRRTFPITPREHGDRKGLAGWTIRRLLSNFSPGFDSAALAHRILVHGGAQLMILAGDLGGTKANLGLFETRDGKLALVARRRYPSRGHSSAEEIAQAFLRETGASISAACFAVAGPVIDNRVHVTNL